MRTLIRWVTAGLLAVAVTVGTAGAAAAHNVLTSSDPADGAVLDTAPASVSLTFDQPVQDFEPVIAVTGPNGNRFDLGPVTVSGSTVGIDLAGAGPAGDYTVAYRVVSADGHPVTGQLGYTLSAQAAGTAAGVPPGDGGDQAAADQDGGGLGFWLWAGIALAAILVVAAVVVMLRRPTDGA